MRSHSPGTQAPACPIQGTCRLHSGRGHPRSQHETKTRRTQRSSAPASCFLFLPTGLVPLSRLLKLPDLPFHNLALYRTHLVEKHDPVAVISFVQHTTRREFHSVKFEPFSSYVLGSHDCP